MRKGEGDTAGGSSKAKCRWKPKVRFERTADILHLETIETLELSVAVSSILRLLRIDCSNSAVCIQ